MADSQWQPAETAPENIAILVRIPNAIYHGNDGVYCAVRVNVVGAKRWMTFGLHIGHDCDADHQPTHWMPMPSVSPDMH